MHESDISQMQNLYTSTLFKNNYSNAFQIVKVHFWGVQIKEYFQYIETILPSNLLKRTLNRKDTSLYFSPKDVFLYIQPILEDTFSESSGYPFKWDSTVLQLVKIAKIWAHPGDNPFTKSVHWLQRQSPNTPTHHPLQPLEKTFPQRGYPGYSTHRHTHMHACTVHTHTPDVCKYPTPGNCRGFPHSSRRLYSNACNFVLH